MDLPAGNEKPSIPVIYHQITALNAGVGELKGMLKTLDERMRAHELNDVANQTTNSQKLDAAHKRLDENENHIKGVDKRLADIEIKMPLIDDILNIRLKIIFWVFISGFLGTTLSGLFLALLFNFFFEGFGS